MSDNKNQQDSSIKPSGFALFPLLFFFLSYLLVYIFTGSLTSLPISVAFLLTSIVAILTTRKIDLVERIKLFCKGCANETIMLMIVVFMLAGAFSATVNGMGAVDATVQMMLYFLPSEVILASLFVAACFMSMSMGTSTGTITTLAPIAVGFTQQLGLPLPMVLGIIVGGSMFGDNLSFISDTTIAATETQGCSMKDKFLVNIRIVYPVALIMIVFYLFKGFNTEVDLPVYELGIEWVKVLPYLVILVMAMMGVNVLLVLFIGVVLSGGIGLLTQSFSVVDWFKFINQGMIVDMGELIIVTLMAGGLFALIHHNGGILWLIEVFLKNVKSKRAAEFFIAGLVAITNMSTANNTIAILVAGPIAKETSDRFQLNNKRVASILDTMSCFVQGLLPYGAQLLIVTSLASKAAGFSITPMEVIPYLYYPMLLGLATLLSIFFRYPKKYV